jgi:hypothetical protein
MGTRLSPGVIERLLILLLDKWRLTYSYPAILISLMPMKPREDTLLIQEVLQVLTLVFLAPRKFATSWYVHETTSKLTNGLQRYCSILCINGYTRFYPLHICLSADR